MEEIFLALDSIGFILKNDKPRWFMQNDISINSTDIIGVIRSESMNDLDKYEGYLLVMYDYV